MATFRVNRDAHFTTVNNHILRNKNASLKAKGLLVWMLSCDKNWNFSLSGMVSCLKEKEDAISSTLKELETLGYLKRTKLMPETDITTGEVIRSRVEWVYDIYEIPQQILYTDFQSIEIQSTENPVIRNTKEKEIPIKKGTGAGASSKNHSQVYKKRESLNDDLQSGKDIDKQKSDKEKSPKEKFKDECLDIVEKRYSGKTKDLLIEYFDFVTDRKQATHENKDKVISTGKVTLWENKLNHLDELVANGDDINKLIQQSLEQKKYKFFPLESSNNKYNYNKRGGELLDDKIVGNDVEEARQRLEEDESEEWY